MCIMFVKECNQEFPSHETMKVCWDDNRDGAGYAWYNEKTRAWKVVKGLMDWNGFLHRFEEDRKTYDLDNKLVCVHFRVGTTGPKNGGATHPFPFVNTTEENVHATEYETKGIMFHNGTLSNGTFAMSDTALAALQYWHIVPHIFENGKTNKGLLKILEEVLNAAVCRYAVCYENNLLMLGPWVKDEESGLMYSNERYVEEKTWRYKAHKAVEAENKAKALRDAAFKNNSDTQVLRMPKDVREWTKFVGTDGLWDWQKWDDRYKTDDKTKVKKDAEKSFDVMDASGNVLFTVDPIEAEAFENGEIRDVTPTTSGVVCITCQTHVKDRSFLNEGECPGCGTLLDPEWNAQTYPADAADEDAVAFDYRDVYVCPTCKESAYIVDAYTASIPLRMQKALSDFTKCNKCNCVWGYTDDDKEWVIGFEDGNTGSIGFENQAKIPVGNNKDEVRIGGSKI